MKEKPRSQTNFKSIFIQNQPHEIVFKIDVQV